MRFVLSLACLLALTIFVPTSGATNASPACGEVVTENVTLRKSLKGCASGLIVGADNVTIDLNGHSIKGLGTETGIGIDALGRTGVTLKNGTISDFAEGVVLLNTSNSTIKRLAIRRTLTGIRVTRTDDQAHSNQILDNSVRDSQDGIDVFEAVASRIAGNTLSSLSGTGILCRNAFEGDLQIERNRSFQNGFGIQLFFCRASVTENIVSLNASSGIVRSRSNGPTVRNVVLGNGGNGIFVEDSPGLVLGNVTTGNRSHGLMIVDQLPEFGPFYTVTANIAFWNGGLGITTNLEGIVDGGNNRARHNGDPRQCVGVACT